MNDDEEMVAEFVAQQEIRTELRRSIERLRDAFRERGEDLDVEATYQRILARASAAKPRPN